MLDNLVVCIKLVITTLAILNSIGIVSLQNDLEYGLATDCDYRSMKKLSLIQKISKFFDKVCCFLDLICGDKCIDRHSKCECGDITIHYGDYKYCCIQMNETCEAKGMFCKDK